MYSILCIQVYVYCMLYVIYNVYYIVYYCVFMYRLFDVITWIYYVMLILFCIVFGDVILSAVVRILFGYVQMVLLCYVSVLQFLCYICVLWCSGVILSRFVRII